MDDHTFQAWLDEAVKGIVFRPDRAAVRQELADHLEDRTADLKRIFPNLTDEEARDRALAWMGDAAEVSRQLARVHRPWLGWLWRASQVLLAVSLAWLFLIGPHWGWLADQFGWFDDGPHGVSEGAETEIRIPFSSEETVRAGPYTLRAEGVLELNPLSDWDAGYFQVTWHAWSPRFWETPTASTYWQAEDDQNNRYPSYHQWSVYGRLGTQSQQRVYSLTWRRSGLGWTGESQVEAVPQDAQWVRLTLDLGAEPVTVLLEREEEQP